MAFNTNKFEIVLLLKPLAYHILIEERPGVEVYITSFKDKEFKFKFSATIATLLPISRFCMGLPGFIKMLTFSGGFVTNVQLPDFIGMGKSVSRGYGTIRRSNS